MVLKEGGFKKNQGLDVFGVVADEQLSERWKRLLLLLRQEHRVDVREHTARGDGHVTHELVELLVVADGELHVAGDDAGLLVVAGGVAGELEDLGGEVNRQCAIFFRIRSVCCGVNRLMQSSSE